MLRRRLFPTTRFHARFSALRALVAAAIVTAGIAISASPAAAAGTITVTPTTGLVDAQVVTITGTGWVPGATIGYCQAVPIDPPSQSNCADGTGALTNADENGNFSVSLTIARLINVPSAGGLVDCAAPAAPCVAGAADISDIAGTATWEHLHFAPVSPIILLQDNSVLEGHTGATSLPLPVTLTFAATETVTADWTIVNSGFGCDADPATDYTSSASGTVTFVPGDIEEAVTITINGDTVIEPDECVALSFTNPTNATISGSGLAVGTILNDDVPLTVNPGFGSVFEGNAGTTDLSIPVTLSFASADTVTVQWVTFVNPGPPACQADPATDYTPSSGTVTFVPGDTDETVTISVNGDTAVESDECVIVSFRNATNAQIGGFFGIGVGTIVNDEPRTIEFNGTLAGSWQSGVEGVCDLGTGTLIGLDGSVTNLGFIHLALGVCTQPGPGIPPEFLTVVGEIFRLDAPGGSLDGPLVGGTVEGSQFTIALSITGGTGNFDGASGAATVQGTLDTSGASTGTIAGTLELPA
jgi:hypothetical protein